MRLPNKVTPYHQSILPKLIPILTVLKDEALTPDRLYKEVKKQVVDVAEFTDILTCLYALNKVDLLDGEVLVYVENDL